MIVDKIERMCEERDIALSALERKADVSNGVIKRWAYSTPRLRTLKKVAKALGVDPTELIEKE